MPLCLAYMTFKNKEEAKKIGEKLVKKKTVACFNIMGSGESIYLWKDTLQTDSETFALAKLSEESFNALEKILLSEHSYEVPALLKIPIQGGSEPFLRWIKESSKH